LRTRAGALVTLAALAALPACTEGDLPPELVSFVSWSGNPVFAGREDGWDQALRERGLVIRDGAGYRLYYAGGLHQSVDDHLGLARSADGLHFERVGSAPMVAGRAEDPCVIHDGARFLLAAETGDDQMQLFDSADGLAWQSRGPIDVRDTRGQPLPARTRRGTPTLFVTAGLYYLYYELDDAGIWLARSRDLVSWVNVQDQPVLTLGPGPEDDLQVTLNQIVVHRGRYYAYFSGLGRERRWSTNLAVSDDLISWRKYAGNPLLPIADDQTSGIVVADRAGFRLYTMRGDGTLHVHLNPF